MWDAVEHLDQVSDAKFGHLRIIVKESYGTDVYLDTLISVPFWSDPEFDAKREHHVGVVLLARLHHILLIWCHCFDWRSNENCTGVSFEARIPKNCSGDSGTNWLKPAALFQDHNPQNQSTSHIPVTMRYLILSSDRQGLQVIVCKVPLGAAKPPSGQSRFRRLKTRTGKTHTKTMVLARKKVVFQHFVLESFFIFFHIFSMTGSICFKDCREVAVLQDSEGGAPGHQPDQIGLKANYRTANYLSRFWKSLGMWDFSSFKTRYWYW